MALALLGTLSSLTSLTTMATVALTSNLLSIPSAINAITNSMYNIYGIMDSLTRTSKTTNIKDVVEFMEKTDLKANLEIYSCLIKEIGKTNSKTLTICINNIRETIKEIEGEMIIINDKKKFNDSLYTGTKWRSYTFRSNIKKLTELVERLDKRMKTLQCSYEIISRRQLNDQIQNQTQNQTQTLNQINDQNSDDLDTIQKSIIQEGDYEYMVISRY